MPIITQAGLTALRNLKYGDDQPGRGSSGEPYIVQKLPPPYKEQVDSTNIWNSDNGLIRGGFTGATYASYLDTRRIGKFLLDPPRGPLFIIKQVGLQLSNPKLETRADGAFTGDPIGPTRLYNLGVNTLAQVPVNAFGGHIIRHGPTPVLDVGQTYSRVVTANDAPGTFGENNRLVALKAKLQSDVNANIANYVSGPGSIDGIGRTLIRRYYSTLNNPQFNQYEVELDFSAETETIGAGQAPNTVRSIRSTNIASRFTRSTPVEIDYFLAQGVSEQYFNRNLAEIEDKNNITTGSLISPPSQINQNVIVYSPAGKNYDALKTTIENQAEKYQIGIAYPNITTSGSATGPVDFVYIGKSRYKNSKYPDGLPLGGEEGFNIEQRIGIPGVRKRDEINSIPLYTSPVPPGAKVIKINGKEYNPRDLIKFRIEAVNGDSPNLSTWMLFRALLTDISDNPNPSWNTINYVGRGEPFYIYNGFERTVSFTFQVAAMSEEEMKPLWQKMNYLYSNVMPDYSDNIMRGPYMKLTIGNYMYRQPGVIKGLTYTIDNKSPWEIAIDDPERGPGEKMYELPHVMTISMIYAPVHNFLPRKFPSTFTGTWSDLPAFVVDRDDNENEWLTSIYNKNPLLKGVASIPAGTI